MRYETYTVDDFVMDTSFQAWVQQPNEESDAFWERWIAAHPAQQPIIAEARVLIESMQFNPNTMPAQRAAAIWKELEKTVFLQTEEKSPVSRNPADIHTKKHLLPIYTVWKAVAGIVGFIMVVALYVFLNDWASTRQFNTSNGETKRLILPDGSTVILNANSEISFAEDWTAKPVREVWLNGEAFFSVVHTTNHQKFVVHTDNHLQVEVLGTEFNVAKRKRRTQVVLQSGKIQLKIQPDSPTNTQPHNLLMKPGELVEFDEQSDTYTRKEVNPEVYSSWKSDKLLLDHTSLQEVLQLIESSYGFKIKVLNPEVLTQQVSGSMPLENTDVLLQHIAQTFEVKINRTGDLLTVQQISKTK